MILFNFFAEVPIRGPEFADDEEPWVPWEKKPASQVRRIKWATYTGHVPAVVRPIGEARPSRRCLRAHVEAVDTSGQVVLPDETACENHSLIHYLDHGARGPVFVDGSALRELLAEDPMERGLRAPILGSLVSSTPEGEELVYRYHRPANPRKPLIYVGQTWVKKGLTRTNMTLPLRCEVS